MIEITDLNYKEILNNINVKIESGIIGLIGANGAGKSTLVKCISGINKNYSGEIFIKGKNLKNLSFRELATILCYIPQKTFINYDISVRDFLFFSRYSYNENIKNCNNIINNALEKINMQNYVNKNLKILSGGEFQKIMLASAIVQGSSIWLLDEPASALDPGSSVEFYKTLKEICSNNNITIVLISHDLNHILNNCDNIIAMSKGTIIKKSEVATFLDKNILKEVYNIDFLIEKRQDKFICIPSI
ncbi:MAG: ABC transporter ATP-binding protein [Candidatus Muirbacterium halophilum]|nr:ABC transporter ATP-binding protein [Candidatus Muirbacterium halophilum]MCK9476275.1 ABC transporter ATP-binding protein [Candidatus Muirbacterium halophilum]